MMGRPKKSRLELVSLAACNAALGDLRVAIADIQALTAERDMAVAAASAKWEEFLDERKERRDELVAGLEGFYYEHLAEIEKDGAKHVQLANGVIGRRDNPAALKPLNRKWSWAAIANAVKAKFGLQYFRTAEPELNKEALKAAKLAVEELKQLGLKLEAGETFYAEPAVLPAPGEVA